MDQADSLRQLVRSQGRNDVSVVPSKKEGNTRVIAVTSGKGGVGKSNISLNLGIAIAKNQNKKVLILDADFGTANVDILMGVFPKYNISNVIYDQIPIEDVIVEGPYNIKVLPGVSGVAQLTSLTENQKQFFFEQLELYQDKHHPDIIIIDTGAGVGNTVMNFLLAADEVIVVLTSEPTSLSDAYAVTKTLHQYNNEMKVSIIVNMVNSENEALKVYSLLQNVCNKFLNKDIEYLGHVSSSKTLCSAVREQRPVLVNYPNAVVSYEISKLAKKIISIDPSSNKSFSNFFSLATKYFGWND
ncbi:MAG: MinD/ParA family protein [Candidatus Riflemargulisbacteria bacterium]|jgi:flagellar biosynthesis protein FlhG